MKSERKQRAVIRDLAATAQLPVATKTAEEMVKQLPGLIGAIDKAVFDIAGKPLAFMLVIFADGQAMHATNGDHAEVMAAVKQVVGG